MRIMGEIIKRSHLCLYYDYNSLRKRQFKNIIFEGDDLIMRGNLFHSLGPTVENT